MVKCPRCKQEFTAAIAGDSASTIPAEAQLPEGPLAPELKVANASRHLTSTPQQSGSDSIDPNAQKTAPNSNLVPCADCGKIISKRATSCPSCGAPTQNETKPPIPEVIPLEQSGTSTADQQRVSVLSSGNGVLFCTGPYGRLFALTKQAMQVCQVKIKSSSESSGEIHGKAPYGINVFGMSIYASLSPMGSQTKIEVRASFTDAFDTFGACRKKVDQILQQLVMTIGTASPPAADMGAYSGVHVTPRLSAKVGQSQLGKAIVGFLISLSGLCFWPLAIVGLIMSNSVYMSINVSNNKSGRTLALCGTLVGFVGVVFPIVALIRYLQSLS